MTDFSSSVDAVKDVSYEKQLADRLKMQKMTTDKMVAAVADKLSRPPEHITVEEQKEVLPDGTIHLTRKVIKRTITHIERHKNQPESISEEGSAEMDENKGIKSSVSHETLETFEKPPHPETIVMHVDQVLPSGETQQRKVVKNRMVHRIKTRCESFDAEHGSMIDEYEIDEVIPGTESIWFADSANVSPDESESEEESDTEEQQTRTDLGKVEEIAEDGTIIYKEIVETHTTKTRTIHSRSGSVERETLDTVVTEEFITPSPSPRSASPVEPKFY